MSIRLIVTRGYGNGTFLGDIAHVVTRGYSIGEGAVIIFCPPHISNRVSITYSSDRDSSHSANILNTRESDKC